MVGTEIGSYRIEEKIGEGGMGTVYRATETNLHRTVAIKVLNANVARDPSLGERFRQEARSQANLNHTNIATLYTFLIHEGMAMMVMEFVTGENFQQMISRRGPIPSNEAIPLFKQSLLGIGYAHRMGIVHRDIKPANLMLNGAGIVKVMDFGIAKAVGERGMTRTGTQVGTVHYMSPEQVKSENVDTRSDIYALGITLYEMLSGRVPFDANSEFEVLTDHVKTPPPLPSSFHPSISKGVEGVVLKALAKNPNDRFQTVEEFGAALERPELWESQVPAVTAPITLPTFPRSAPKNTSFETAELNFAMPPAQAAPAPPPLPPPPPAPVGHGRGMNTGMLAGIAAGGVVLIGLIAFAAYSFWPHPAPPTPVASVTPTVTPAPTIPDVQPAIPPGAFDPPASTATPAGQPAASPTAKPSTTRPNPASTMPNTAVKPPTANPDTSAPPPPPPLAAMRVVDMTIPAGQEVVVRLTSAIDGNTTQTGLIYSAVVNAPVSINGRPAIASGSTAEIEVSSFEKPGRTKGGGKLDLALKSITVAGHKYTVASDVFEVTGSARPKKGGKFGVIGAVAGGVAHGVKDAVGARDSSATGLDLAPETLLTFHLTAPLTVSGR